MLSSILEKRELLEKILEKREILEKILEKRELLEKILEKRELLEKILEKRGRCQILRFWSLWPTVGMTIQKNLLSFFDIHYRPSYPAHKF